MNENLLKLGSSAIQSVFTQLSSRLLDVGDMRIGCTLNVACRSLYYGESTQHCVHMMYADALLPSTFTSNQTGWKRLAKTSYRANSDGR
ncbi:hypothetical protein CRM22_003063 [Opisthorchis felineus]|uniref:Uncharacterized protein n=1 Tax=Opisthorchis felineus TaxID=147828 RepID=A0A4S2M328_OPIFE|nr:hypothetical protein CRM22_003063 [Opisthorchis felineus]